MGIEMNARDKLCARVMNNMLQECNSDFEFLRNFPSSDAVNEIRVMEQFKKEEQRDLLCERLTAYYSSLQTSKQIEKSKSLEMLRTLYTQNLYDSMFLVYEPKPTIIGSLSREIVKHLQRIGITDITQFKYIKLQRLRKLLIAELPSFGFIDTDFSPLYKLPNLKMCILSSRYKERILAEFSNEDGRFRFLDKMPR
jgi:hypothetical protein